MRAFFITCAVALLLAAAFWWPEIANAGLAALDYTLNTYLTLYMDSAGLRSGCLF